MGTGHILEYLGESGLSKISGLGKFSGVQEMVQTLPWTRVRSASPRGRVPTPGWDLGRDRDSMPEDPVRGEAGVLALGELFFRSTRGFCPHAGA